MTQAKARVFMNGRSQHVTIPREFRFRTSEVLIHRNDNGSIVLTEVPSLDKVFEDLDAAEIPHDFLLDRDKSPAREPEGLSE
jgi:virulence-associated protein VagC